MSNQGEAFLWYAAKQNAKIFIQEDNEKKALKLITNTYEKLSKKNIYQTFDFAKFLKNNEKFDDAIEIYTQIIKKINKDYDLQTGTCRMQMHCIGWLLLAVISIF